MFCLKHNVESLFNFLKMCQNLNMPTIFLSMVAKFASQVAKFAPRVAKFAIQVANIATVATCRWVLKEIINFASNDISKFDTRFALKFVKKWPSFIKYVTFFVKFLPKCRQPFKARIHEQDNPWLIFGTSPVSFVYWYSRLIILIPSAWTCQVTGTQAIINSITGL